ncbi:MAG: hypothetical protein ACOY94_04410 [Bacillota bacterium]
MINPAKSPPLFVPIGMILAGLTGLLLFFWLLIDKAPMAFGPYRFNPATLAVVHLFTLGFATAVMVGAFYQITPVMMIGRPVNGWWAAAQGVTYLVGTALLVVGFYRYDTLLIITGGTIVVVALMLFMVLVGRSMRSATQWTISGSFMVAGLANLAGTVLWGLTLALNLRWNFLSDTLSNAPLGAHLVLGVGGWFMLTIFGVTYQLIPMFALSSRGHEAPAKAVLALLSLGLWGAFAGLALRLPSLVTTLSLVLALAGVAIYGVDMAGIIRRRRRPELDLGMRYAMVSFGFLVLALPTMALGAGPLPEMAVAGAWFFLPGFVGSMILGMLYKIVPFLYWHYLLKTRTDKTQRLPTLVQMYSGSLATAGFWLWLGGLFLTGLLLVLPLDAALTRWPLALAALGSLCFVATILQVLRAKPLS